MARHLVEHFNADFLSSYPTTSAYNALTWAAGYSPDCLLYAINERDIDVNACDPGLRTSLHHAMWYNQSRMVEFLLEKKADPTARSKTGWGPLSFAAQEGHIEAMKAMLDRTTVAVNIVDNSERTALHIAAKYGKAEACRLLVEAKIDVEMKDVQQLSALDVATGDAAKYLFDLCPLDIFQAIKTNRAMTEIVVQRDTALRVDWIRLKNDAGKTPIMYALEEGKHESLELLLEAVPNDMKEEVFENKMNEGATNLFMSAMLKPSCLTAIVKWFNPELELDNEQSVVRFFFFFHHVLYVLGMHTVVRTLHDGLVHMLFVSFLLSVFQTCRPASSYCSLSLGLLCFAHTTPLHSLPLPSPLSLPHPLSPRPFNTTPADPTRACRFTQQACSSPATHRVRSSISRRVYAVRTSCGHHAPCDGGH